MPAQRCPRARHAVDNRVERLCAVAPHRVHLEVATVFPRRGLARARQDLLHRRTAEEVLPERTQGRDLVRLARLPHRLLDEGRLAVVNQLARNPVGCRPDPGNRAERIRVDQWRDVLVQPQHGLGGPFIPPRSLVVTRKKRHIEQKPGQGEVDVHPLPVDRVHRAVVMQ